MFRRILVAYDGSPTAELALEQAFDLARAERVQLVTLASVVPHVHQLVAVGGQDPEALQAVLRRDLEVALRRATAAAPDEARVETSLTEGHAGQALLRVAEEGDHDLILMGSRGRGLVQSVLMGSVGTYVVQHATIAVLVMHAPRGGAPMGEAT